MGLHKLTAGDGYTYLNRQVAVHDATEKGARSLGDYYTEQGESPGRWMGTGLVGLDMRAGGQVSEQQMHSLFGLGRHPNAEQLADHGESAKTALGRAFTVHPGATELATAVAREFTHENLSNGLRWDAPIAAPRRAEIRTRVSRTMFAAEHGRDPTDARELSGFVAQHSRHRTSAVAGFDLTFSPVKSVSVLWALAPPPVAAAVRAAHDAAVADALAWLEREAAFTRLGRGGLRQVPVRGLVAAAFTHRDSRAGDPDLHTHLAVSNKVQTTEGRWLALDGRMLYQANVAASERYNTRLEAELTERLGVRFTARVPSGREPGTPVADASRPIREVVGISPVLVDWWSSRRRAIDARRGTLAVGFQERHGRPPTAVEAIALAQQATLETRQTKHAPRSEAGQREQWRADAERVLDGPGQVEQMLHATLAARPGRAVSQWSEMSIDATAQRMLKRLESDRATWQVWHVRAEAERQVRAAAVPVAEHHRVVDALTNRVLDVHSTRLGDRDPMAEPEALRRPDGESCYRVHGAARYTSARIMSAEAAVMDACAAAGARRISDSAVAGAAEQEATRGVRLNAGQRAMVTELATSGRRVQLALAPAGTGKTTAMRVLSTAWTRSKGTVVGLAPSARAARELAPAIDGHTDTLAKLTWTLKHADPRDWPAWITSLGPETLVVIDEAGQAATTDLADAITHLTACGATTRLAGDDQQLAAVGAGGLLRDIARTHGAATLSAVRRFADPAESAATLAIRDGDPTALAFYADHQRIHVGDLSATLDQTFAAWAADRTHGRDSVMLAPTRELAAQLNTRAWQHHHSNQRPGSDHEPEATLALGDGTQATEGDVVVTRRNNRRLSISATDWVKNGDRWTVEHITRDGSLRVRHCTRGSAVTLPSEYAAVHVQLGYASTVHGAQGITADTAHVVVTGEESRQLLYVGLSRGRFENHLYLASSYDGDSHTLVHPDALAPPTPLEVLASVLAREGGPRSATTEKHELNSCATRLRDAVARYTDALSVAAEDILGAEGHANLRAVEQQIEALWPGLTHEPAYPTLRGHLALGLLTGHDPLETLINAAAEADLGVSEDRAAVLDWRIAPVVAEPGGPLPWLAATPRQLTAHPEWGPYLTARTTQITYLADTIRETAHAWTLSDAPRWAVPFLGCVPASTDTATAKDMARIELGGQDTSDDLIGDLAVWRAVTAAPDSDERPTGPPARATDATEAQQLLQKRARAVTGPTRGQTLTASSSSDHGVKLPDEVASDPAVGMLRRHLDALRRAGTPVSALVAAALAEPRSLPVEMPAAALWWRIVGRLGPAALHVSQPAIELRPTWTPLLPSLLGEATTKLVKADPGWPALVASVEARPEQWDVERLLRAALPDAGADVSPAEICDALIWRIATLTHPPDDQDGLDGQLQSELPPDPEDLDQQQPVDLHLVEVLPTSPPTPTAADPAPVTSSVRVVGVEPDAVPTVSAGRIETLNRAALAFYLGNYPRSWAPGYMQARLGTDPNRVVGCSVGYAPPGPQSLLRHLSETGATPIELLAAGLVRTTDRGGLIDVFRDRLVFAIHDAQHRLVGFMGRRNPRKDEQNQTLIGPKYLNTRATILFAKGEVLYGLAENRAALSHGADLVLVEGPMDALAVTLHSTDAVGVAPLGTAFTTQQATQVAATVHKAESRVVVATDPDTAGTLAAQRIYWHLTRHGLNPQHLQLPTDLDPAELLRTYGSAALQEGLRAAPPLAETMSNALLAQEISSLDSPATRLRLVREVGQIISALPPQSWAVHIDRVGNQLDLPRGMLHLEVLDSGHAWTENPERLRDHRLAELAGKSQAHRQIEPTNLILHDRAGPTSESRHQATRSPSAPATPRG